MNDSVSKISCKDFPVSRSCNDKWEATWYLIRPVVNLISEPSKIAFVVYLKSDSIVCVPFLFTAINICLCNIFYRYHNNSFLWSADTGLTAFRLLTLVFVFRLPLPRFKFHAFVAEFSVYCATFLFLAINDSGHPFLYGRNSSVFRKIQNSVTKCLLLKRGIFPCCNLPTNSFDNREHLCTFADTYLMKIFCDS